MATITITYNDTVPADRTEIREAFASQLASRAAAIALEGFAANVAGDGAYVRDVSSLGGPSSSTANKIKVRFEVEGALQMLRPFVQEIAQYTGMRLMIEFAEADPENGMHAIFNVGWGFEITV
jgi:hypothetical protein